MGYRMKDKKKNNRLWSGELKLKVFLDIIENELSYSQAARKYDMYLSTGSLMYISIIIIIILDYHTL
jgi:hypothetical protein